MTYAFQLQLIWYIDYSFVAADAIHKHLKDKLETGLTPVDTSAADVIKEDIHTRCFLSHRRLTAQGIAGRLYEGLKGDYRLVDLTVYSNV